MTYHLSQIKAEIQKAKDRSSFLTPLIIVDRKPSADNLITGFHPKVPDW